MLNYKILELRLIFAIILLISAAFPNTINAYPIKTTIALTSEESQSISDEITQLLNEAKEQYQSNNENLAITNIKKALSLTEQLSDFDKAEQVSEILSSFAEWGNLVTALEMLAPFQQISDSYLLNIYDQTAANLVMKIVESGDIETAEYWTNKISSVYPKAQALNSIATQLIKQQQTEAASIILNQAIEVSQNITETYESNGSCANYRFEILSQIATNLSKLAQLKQALTIAENVQGCGSASGESGQDYQAEAFLGILENTNNLEELEELFKSSNKINGFIEKAPVWSAIAVKYIEFNQIETALNIAEKISQEIPTITIIDSGLAMREAGVKPQALSKIALALKDAGYQEEALKVAKLIDIPTPEIQEVYPNWREETLQLIINNN